MNVYRSIFPTSANRWRRELLLWKTSSTYSATLIQIAVTAADIWPSSLCPFRSHCTKISIKLKLLSTGLLICPRCVELCSESPDLLNTFRLVIQNFSIELTCTSWKCVTILIGRNLYLYSFFVTNSRVFLWARILLVTEMKKLPVLLFYHEVIDSFVVKIVWQLFSSTIHNILISSRKDDTIIISDFALNCWWALSDRWNLIMFLNNYFGRTKSAISLCWC